MQKQIFLIILTLFLLSSCGDIEKTKQKAESTIDAIQKSYNIEHYFEIVAVSDRSLWEKPGSGVTELMAKVHEKLGPITSSETTGWRVLYSTSGTSAVLVRENKYAQGTGTETFTLSIQDGKAKLIGYNINSNDLIMKN